MLNDWPIDPEFPEGELWLHFDDEVQTLINSFSSSFKVSITIFSGRMEVMLMNQNSQPVNYCYLLQSKLHYRYRCVYANKIDCERCKKQGETVGYHCYAGLSGAVSPIKIRDKLVGYAMLGRIRTGLKVPEKINQAWKTLNFNHDELQKAYRSHAYFDADSLKDMLRLFTMMIAHIGTQEYVHLHQPSVMAKILYWIDMHTSEKIKLDDVAKAVMCSCSTVSHTVKQQLGMNFNDLCTLKKIEHFERLITADPLLSIKEAASMVGYDDQLYFSRVYKKIRQMPPLHYVNVLRQNATGTPKPPG
ncbi:MAG: PocR ligand-binding domain-containing protein [Treponema sp.]|jgi:AraC-like DNA-binding protein|nr:PocR ligand-binding domain-containing protein [Treponema sp.]